MKKFKEWLNESWPFDGKKHVDNNEARILAEFAHKNSILYTYDEADKSKDIKAGTVKDPRFQSSNEEHAWELFEIWVSSCTMGDLRMYLAENTWMPHDDIWPNEDREAEIGEKGTAMLVSMMKRRAADSHGTQDLKTLENMRFLIPTELELKIKRYGI